MKIEASPSLLIKHTTITAIMEFVKRIVCTVMGAIIGGLTGILMGAMAGASDHITLDRTIQRLEMARDIIRAQEEREKAIQVNEASHIHHE